MGKPQASVINNGTSLLGDMQRAQASVSGTDLTGEMMENGGINGRVVIERWPGWLTLYSDGSFERFTDLDRPACSDVDDGVASRDVVMDSSKGIWARIFLPASVATGQGQGQSNKVPVVLHFHGGGFCLGSPASPHVHDLCTRMAIKSSCMWVSVNYRLAPEHPLPAAYEDADTALLWLRSQARAGSAHDPWLAQYADLSNCFIAGESAGGTIVHFLAARASDRDWSPLCISGLLIIHPAFPQEKPETESISADSDLSSLRVHFYHTSALPPGAPFGHPLMNPLHADSPIKLSDITLPPLLVAVAEKDPLRPGDLAYFHALQNCGKNVQLFESHGVGHCFHTNPGNSASAVEMLENAMIEFIRKLTVLERR